MIGITPNPRLLACGEQAEQRAITLDLRGFARGGKARHQWCVAFVNSPLPSRWFQLDYRDFEQAYGGLLGHPRNMQCG
jgi:hypothetical protein